MFRNAETIRSRIAVLQSRARDNGRIIRKLQRELRRIGG